MGAGGDLQTGSSASPTNRKFQKPDIFLEGSWHPISMNPFEYGKSFSKRIGFGIGIIITQATKKYCTAICYIKMGEYQTKCGALCMEEPEKLTFEIENIS